MYITNFKKFKDQINLSDIKIKQLLLYYNALFYFIVRIPVDEYCTQNEQCQRNENSRVCENNRCVCRAEYIQYNLKCYEGKLDFFPKKAAN